jgi:hypothetical protein
MSTAVIAVRLAVAIQKRYLKTYWQRQPWCWWPMVVTVVEVANVAVVVNVKMMVMVMMVVVSGGEWWW